MPDDYPRTKKSVLAELKIIEENKASIQQKYELQKQKLEQRSQEKINQITNQIIQKREVLDKEYQDAIAQHDSNIQKIKTKHKKVLERAD